MQVYTLAQIRTCCWDAVK